MISAVRGPENLPSIPLKNVKQTNKQQQKQKQKSKKGQRSNKVFITVHTIEWPKINIGTREDKGTEKASPIHTLFHRLFVSSYF